MPLNLPPYFGGSGANLGIVSGLTPATFADFIKEVLGNPALVNSVSRSEYAALPKDRRSQSKRVPYFTAAAFNASPCQRVYEHATHCNLVCVDIDDSKYAGAFVAHPPTLRERLNPFAFAAYTTASSTPEAPRLRVVVRADHLGLGDYPAAVRYVAMLLGLPAGGFAGMKESQVAVQPMYLPTLFRGDDPVSDHPLVIAVPDGAAVTAATVAGSSVPAPSVQPGERGSPGHPPSDEIAELEFLRPPVEGLTPEDAESALLHIDPDCPYSEWVEVAAALRHQFTGRQAEEGFKLFNEWSAQGEKYTDPEDTKAKWDSFRVSPRGRAPVTFRSILKRATEAGWKHAEAVGARCYEATKQWIASPERSAKDLMAQGPSRIATTPLISELQKGALLSALWDGLKRHKIAVTRVELRGAVTKVEREMARAASKTPKVSTPDEQLPAWARGLCYVAGQDEFYQRHTGRSFKPQVLDSFFSVQLMTAADEARAQPAVRPRDYLLNLMKCPRVDDYTYDPSRVDPIVQDGKRRAVNLYIPDHPDPDPTTAEEAGALFQAHVKNLIAEPEYQQTLIDYLAYHVQHPGEKIRWSVVLQGAEGCGKTTLSEAMRAVLGSRHVRNINAELLFTGFNGWAMGSQLVAIEEIRVVGHNRYEVMNNLKPCISNDHVSINEKNLRAFQTKNVTNYLMFTNHQDALAIGEGDRRYFVLFSKLQNKAQIRELGDDYFPRLFEMFRTQAPGLRAWFESWPISENFNPHGHAPDTPYRQAMIRTAAPAVNGAIMEILEEGAYLTIQRDILSLTALTNALELHRLGAQASDRNVTTALLELGYQFIDRAMVGGTRHRLYAHRNVRMTPADARDLFISRVENADVLE